MSLADRFRFFADVETAGASPLYTRLAHAIADDDDLISYLGSLSTNFPLMTTFFAAVNYLGGISDDENTVRAFIRSEGEAIGNLLSTRTTQTNEIGRCAVLLPAIALIEGPVALVELGASAGLNLLLDRFAYAYGSDRLVGDASSSIAIPCELRTPAPIPSTLPEVVWRKGIDLDPIDVRDGDAVRWLEACVFADNAARRDRLRAAVELAREDPPEVVSGNLLDLVADVVAEAPTGTTTVVFHSAVLGQVEPSAQERFEALMRDLDVVWLSVELPMFLRRTRDNLTRSLPAELCFLLGRNGSEALAFSHPHGLWLEWIA